MNSRRFMPPARYHIAPRGTSLVPNGGASKRGMTPTKEVRGHPCQTSAWGETGKASVPEHLDTCSVRYVRAAVYYISRSTSRSPRTRQRRKRTTHTPRCVRMERVLDRPLQPSLYSRAAVSIAWADALFIEPSALGIMPSSMDFAMSAFE